MLESIKCELTKTKSNLEAQKTTEIAAQKAKAEIELIAPKVAELEAEKQQALKSAKDSYDQTASGITATYENKKTAYTEQVYLAVENKVSENFQRAIDGVEKLLAEE